MAQTKGQQGRWAQDGEASCSCSQGSRDPPPPHSPSLTQVGNSRRRQMIEKKKKPCADVAAKAVGARVAVSDARHAENAQPSMRSSGRPHSSTHQDDEAGGHAVHDVRLQPPEDLAAADDGRHDRADALLRRSGGGGVWANSKAGAWPEAALPLLQRQSPSALQHGLGTAQRGSTQRTSVRMMSAAALAADVAPATAMPTLARLSAGASFTPSPEVRGISVDGAQSVG